MEDLSAVLSKYPFVVSYHLLKFERTQSTRRLKIAVDIADGSRLIISDATTPRGFRYAYHWQDANGQLLARWDNAPHHRHLPTFPDHFHNDQRIEPSVQPTIHDVLKYIAEQLSSKQS